MASVIGMTAAAVMVVAAPACCLGAQARGSKGDDSELPDGPGRAVIRRSCSSCHNASVITAKPGRTDDEWTDVLNKMIGRGAVLSDEDGDALMQYLAMNFGPGWRGRPAASQASTAGSTSSGKGPPPDVSKTAGTPTSPSPANLRTPVNVNKATAEQLHAALGVTSNEAELIVRHREQYGEFKSWKDVAAVRGITAEKIQENQNRLTF